MTATALLAYHEPGLSRTFMPETTEADLFAVWARRIRRSDGSAFESFFRALHEPLCRYAESFVTDPAVAGDLVQDAFIRIWDGRQRLDPEQSLKAFAYRTVRNLCLNRIRDARNRQELLVERYEPPQRPAARPDEAVEARTLAGRLETWIAELPARQREALELSRFQGLSHDEVAQAMEVSPRTVNNHLVKALRTLRDRIRAYEPNLLES